MKREAGTGSIYKAPGNRHKPWVAVAPSRYDENGKRVKKTIGTYHTKKEAAEALAKYSLSPFDSSFTLADIYNMFMEEKGGRLSEGTLKNYQFTWVKLEPIHKMKMVNIRTAHLQDALDNELPSRQKITKSLLNSLYKIAMKNDIVQKDYSKYINPASVHAKEKEIFTEEEIKLLWDNVDLEYVPSILTMIYSGMRVSEMLNLKPSSCDLDKNIFVQFGQKTKEGKERVVPIHPLILPLIQERMNGTYIFDHTTPQNYRKRYKSTLEKIGINYKSSHSCRHTFATRLADFASPLQIQKLMGHTNYALTANVYSHPDVEKLKNIIGQL